MERRESAVQVCGVLAGDDVCCALPFRQVLSFADEPGAKEALRWSGGRCYAVQMPDAQNTVTVSLDPDLVTKLKAFSLNAIPLEQAVVEVLAEFFSQMEKQTRELSNP